MPEGRVTRTAEVAYVVLIIAIAGVILQQAIQLPPAPYDPMGPKALPIGVAVGLGALGLIMLAKLLFGRGLSRTVQSMVVGLEADGAGHVRRPLTAVLIVLLAIAYAIAFNFPSIGFFRATTVYLFLSGLVLSRLEWRNVAGVAVFAVTAAYALDLLFRVLFQLDLN